MLFNARYQLHSKPHWLLSTTWHSPVPSSLHLSQHSQKWKVSQCEAHLWAFLAHFWSLCTSNTQLSFKRIICTSSLQGLQCFCITLPYPGHEPEGGSLLKQTYCARQLRQTLNQTTHTHSTPEYTATSHPRTQRHQATHPAASLWHCNPFIYASTIVETFWYYHVLTKTIFCTIINSQCTWLGV